MKKIFDQTVRDIKREVNKNVLKVPRIEQKVLDATSNEPWGPHGTLLAEIAQATRNYHEYQMIMTILWKRINDTGKNWRHVYKGLLVLEYLVANGSERVIDDIREHGYQLSALSDFQYIDSTGRDQGNNVRKKSQSLVVLVNDKERIIEVRQKAAANRDKFRNTSAGGMYRPSSYSSTGGYGDRYDDDRYEGRYGSRDDYGYGRDREYNYKDEDRYGRSGDPYGREGDRYGRESEEGYGRDGYRDDDYRGRSQSVEDYGPRSRSADRERDRAFDNESQSSSRSGGRVDDQAQDGRRLERKLSEQSPVAPPSYEEAISESRSPAYSERNGDSLPAHAPGASPPALINSSPPPPKDASPTESNNTTQTTSRPSASPEVGGFDEFDPRGHIPTSVASGGSTNNEVDLLGSLALAIVPVTPDTTAPNADPQANVSGSSFSAASSNTVRQPFEDPFGDSPFKAIPSTDNVPTQQQTSASAPSASFQANINNFAEAPHVDSTKATNTFQGMNHPVPDAQHPSVQSQFLSQELSASNHELDILADVLPSSDPSPAVASQSGFSVLNTNHAESFTGTYGSFNQQAGAIVPVSVNMDQHASQLSSGSFASQGAPTVPSNVALPYPVAVAPNGGNVPIQQVYPFAAQNANQVPAQNSNGNFLQHTGSGVSVSSQVAYQTATPPLNNGNFAPQQGPTPSATSQLLSQTPSGPSGQQSGNVVNIFSQGSNSNIASQPSLASSTGSLSAVPQPSKDKFETKSTVWTDTLSRGLVNLNISGPKTNPLADIGVDFDALNRKEKRMEKPKPISSTVTSTVTMGKAMGSGSGIGRAGANAIRPPTNPMMGSGMGMGNGIGMGITPGSGFGMGGYGSMNQPMGMGMGMGMGMNQGMNMGQGSQIQRPTGYPSGAYNPMMGPGGYNQQPYGAGYR